MNLYLISQIENEGYDTFDSMVVCAESEEDAKSIHPMGCNSYWETQSRIWATSPQNVSVKYLGLSDDAIESGIVLASFNAG